LASAAASAIGKCESPGVQMSMTSMSLRATTSSQRVAASSQPRVVAAFFTSVSFLPQTTLSTGS